MLRRTVILIGVCVTLLACAASFAGEPGYDPSYAPVPQQHGHLFPQPPRVPVQQPNSGATQRYLILQPAAQGYGQGMHPSPYAYGWFGAASRGHYGYGRGYYDDVRFWKPN